MSKNELTTAQKAYARRVIKDPVLFARNIIGVELWDQEIEILRSIEK